jgi:hypothetical protein
MKKLIQFYDINKPNQISIDDLAIDLYQTLPYHRTLFGDDNVAVYMDLESKQKLIDIGIDCTCIKTNFQPLDNQFHSFRWLSIMAMQTESFQICPIEVKVDKRDGDKLEIEQLILAPYLPVLDKYNIEQTGGICGGDIISVPNARLTMTAYADARNVIYDNEITDESEIQQLMGAFLYKTAIDMGIEIIKFP